MRMDVHASLKDLAERVVSCGRCPRLRAHCLRVAHVKKRLYKDWTYWGKPLPSFGDPHAHLLVVGLAPAAHGGNRTGRMFTGDGSGDWLVRALYNSRFANQPLSVTRDDGLTLRNVYITATVRCAPPRNRPSKEEIENCSGYLMEELRLLGDVKVVLTLGRVAFEAYLSHLPERSASPRPVFRHGAKYTPDGKQPVLIASYHPSRQNTQTGRLSWEAWTSIFADVRRLLS